MPGVARLAELLARHRENLASFVTADENGKHVPAHLERLGAGLEEEQAGLLEKAKALNESVQHAKEIVAMQQNYAKVAGVLETVSLAELVEANGFDWSLGGVEPPYPRTSTSQIS